MAFFRAACLVCVAGGMSQAADESDERIFVERTIKETRGGETRILKFAFPARWPEGIVPLVGREERIRQLAAEFQALQADAMRVASRARRLAAEWKALLADTSDTVTDGSSDLVIPGEDNTLKEK